MLKNRLNFHIRRFKLKDGVYIVTYHHVADSIQQSIDQWGEFAVAKISTEVHLLQDHVNFFKKNFQLVTLGQVVSILKSAGQRVKGRYLAITFDDGYKSVLTQAYREILKKKSIPLTIFLIGNPFLGKRGLARLRLSYLLSTHAKTVLHTFNSEFKLSLKQPEELFAHWKDNYCLDYERAVHDLWERHADNNQKSKERDFFMTLDDLDEFDPALVSFGSHTWDHSMLSCIDDVSQQHQIVDCHTRLEGVLQRKIAFFAYPYGGQNHFDNRARAIVSSMENVCGFSCYGGRNSRFDKTDVRRIGIGNQSIDQLVQKIYSSTD